MLLWVLEPEAKLTWQHDAYRMRSTKSQLPHNYHPGLAVNLAGSLIKHLVQADKRGAAVNTVATLHNELGLTLFSDPVSGPVPATEHFDRATDVLPTFSNGWFNAGACRASKGEHSEAADKCVLLLVTSTDHLCWLNAVT
jgi:hypothetical protein